MAKLHTLTVPDMLWINLQVTKDTQQYNYARLEEAVFCQYGYGDSHEVLAQAGQFLTGFRRLRPFTHGNAACAFIGTLVFLEINGYSVELDEDAAGDWANAIWASPGTAVAEITARAHKHEGDDHAEIPDGRLFAGDLLAKYRGVIATLNQEEPVASLL